MQVDDDPNILAHGIRNLLRCDEAEVVEGIARYVMTQHRVLGRGSAMMERSRRTPLPAFAALLGFMTRFLEVREPESEGEIVWVARLGNERRAIERVRAATPDFKWSEVKLVRPPEAAGWKAMIAAVIPAR